MEIKDDLNIQEPNIIDLNSRQNFKSVPRQNYGIIKSENNVEGSTMPQDNYSKNEIDLKFTNLEQKIDHNKEIILSETKNMFTELRLELQANHEKEREQARKDKRDLIFWSIGTAIAIVGIIIPILIKK